jgi:uncharacterized repeat protein (TIGR03843 family)
MSTTPAAEKLQTALQHGTIELQGQFMLGSNYTFLVDVQYDGQTYQAVYKPIRGEQPLWDFPENTLAQREVAAYLVSQALGWDNVPITVLCADGPYGPGSLQQYIEYDPNIHYFSFNEQEKERLRRVALFDLLANNADRKGSHILIENETDKLWLIDHGLCFNVEDKLRTVIWDFAGQSVGADLLADLEKLRSQLATPSLLATLEPYLSPDEIAAIGFRLDRILTAKTYPHPPESRRAYPWPPV